MATSQSRFDGLIFDMDGTLTRPSLDFAAIRREIGMGAEGDLAQAIKAMPEPRQAEAWAVVESHEKRAISNQQLQDGVQDLFDACRAAGIRLGILTRNMRESVDHLCAKFDLEPDTVVARDFFFIKPHPAPVRHILEQWHVSPDRVLMIGDYIHDIECGIAAGTRTCFFQNPGKPNFGRDADYTVESMAELKQVVFDAGAWSGCGYL